MSCPLFDNRRISQDIFLCVNSSYFGKKERLGRTGNYEQSRVEFGNGKPANGDRG